MVAAGLSTQGAATSNHRFPLRYAITAVHKVPNLD